MEQTVLSIQNLSKSYGRLKAVDNLSLTVEKGTAYGILGPNGSGKTTTLAMIMGILKPDQGEYFWFGKPGSPEQRQKIGTLIEVPNFYPYLSLRKNLEVHARIKNVDVADIGRVLDITGLLKRIHSRFDTLSLGMKQRLSLAAVLLGDPQVLVLDEPANGLDPEGIAEVRRIIQDEVAKGKTIILASHILDEVEKVCTHVGILKTGKLISSGRVEALLKLDDIIILSSEKNAELKKSLLDEGLATDVVAVGDDLEVTPKEGVTAARLNAFATEKGFPLSKITVRKNTLEEQFLELVRNAQ